MSPRRGFTLIEVLVALALTGIVALLAHRLLVVTVTSTRALVEVRANTDQRHQGERWLRQLFGSLEAAGEAGGFDGRPERLEFSAWTPVAEGWMERRRLLLEARDRRLILSGELPSLTLADSVLALELDYLLEPGAESRWVRTWQSPVSAPLAVRLRVTRSRNRGIEVDTMLYLIRERG
jgi:prepilin-type N-terminal cleavage/methylation domain-containing protein